MSVQCAVRHITNIICSDNIQIQTPNQIILHHAKMWFMVGVFFCSSFLRVSKHSVSFSLNFSITLVKNQLAVVRFWSWLLAFARQTTHGEKIRRVCFDIWNKKYACLSFSTRILIKWFDSFDNNFSSSNQINIIFAAFAILRRYVFLIKIARFSGWRNCLKVTKNTSNQEDCRNITVILITFTIFSKLKPFIDIPHQVDGF